MNRRGSRNNSARVLTLGGLIMAALVASRPRKRVPWRWLTDRLRIALQTGIEDGRRQGIDKQWPRLDEVVPYAREQLRVLADAGVVSVIETGRQVTAVELRRTAAAGALVWKTTSKRLLSGMRPTLAAAQIAQEIGRTERTVWRWFAGDTVPSPDDLAKVLSVFMRGQTESAAVGLYLGALADAEGIQQALFNAGLTEKEVERSVRWVVAQFEPYLDALEKLQQYESREGGKL